MKGVVILGVGSSVAESLAHRLAARGHEVAVVDGNAGVAEHLADELRASGGKALHVQARLDVEADAREVAEWCADNMKSVGAVVFANSTKDTWTPEDENAAVWLEMLKINVLGPVVYTRALAPMVRDSGGGSIVYLGSVDGVLSNANLPAYSVTKGALSTLTRVMAVDYGRWGIRVNAVAAAGLDLSGSDGGPNLRGPTADPEDRVRLTPLGRLPEPDEVAAVLEFLASPDSSYVSGAVIPVDGGRIAATPSTILRD